MVIVKLKKLYSPLQLTLCMEYVHWAKQQNRIFLRYMLEVRLMRLLNEVGRYTDVLTIGEFVSYKTYRSFRFDHVPFLL